MNHPKNIFGAKETQAMTQSDMRTRQNNFDLLRFIFSFVVFLVHAYVLSGEENLEALSNVLSSDIAVKSFFVVSGFLIFMSYENSRNASSYFNKRIRRIYPAYFFIVVTCAVLGAAFSMLSWREYCSMAVLKYLVSNLVFLNFIKPDLPGLFAGNRFQAVNGALWTLKIEVMFYLLVPLAVCAFRRVGRWPVLLAVYITSVIYTMILNKMAGETGSVLYLELQRQLPGQLAFFIAGAACYYYLSYLALYCMWLLPAALAAFVLHDWLPWAVVQPAVLAVLVVYFACVFPFLGNFGKHGDFSYGIYIVHFPILQMFVAFGLFKESPWLTLLVAGLLVIVVAFLIWHFIEKKFLRKSSHYVAVESQA